jgi:hypothetical protein
VKSTFSITEGILSKGSVSHGMPVRNQQISGRKESLRGIIKVNSILAKAHSKIIIISVRVTHSNIRLEDKTFEEARRVGKAFSKLRAVANPGAKEGGSGVAKEALQYSDSIDFAEAKCGEDFVSTLREHAESLLICWQGAEQLKLRKPAEQ